jgi:chorismate mutase-like protein
MRGDAIDREMLKLLNERAKQAQTIGSLKGGGPAYRPEREAQVLRALQEENRGPLPNESVAGVFRQVISACLALEQRLRIAYLGPPGTFSHGAVARHFGDFIDAEPYASIDEVFRAAESGQTDHAVVPVENSTEGAVGRTLDLYGRPSSTSSEKSSCGSRSTRCRRRRARRRHQNLFARAVAAQCV